MKRRAGIVRMYRAVVVVVVVVRSELGITRYWINTNAIRGGRTLEMVRGVWCGLWSGVNRSCSLPGCGIHDGYSSPDLGNGRNLRSQPTDYVIHIKYLGKQR